MIIYVVLLLVTAALGVFLHQFASSWNLYDYRCQSDRWQFFVYVLLAFLHFFGMGFTLAGVVAGIVRGVWGGELKGYWLVLFHVISVLLQTLVGIGIEVGHLDYTYDILDGWGFTQRRPPCGKVLTQLPPILLDDCRS